MPQLVAIQLPEEINVLTQRLERERPERLLEIGTYQGGTLFLWCMAAADDATIISIDLPAKNYAAGPGKPPSFLRKMARKGQTLHLLRMNSHSSNALSAVRSILSPRGMGRSRRLDFLFIDGDHTYEGVKTDFEIYSKLVRNGGIVALHDIVKPTPERDPDQTNQVYRFWQELKGQYECEEIVQDWLQGWGGIGIVKIKRQNGKRS